MSTDRRKALEEAFDKLEAKENGDDTEATAGEVGDEGQEEETPEEETAGEEQTEGDEVNGKPPAKSKDEGTEETEESGKPAEGQQQKDPALEAERKAAADAAAGGGGETRPPVSWKPSVREHWNKLPAEVRAEVTRRELEVQRSLSTSDTSRRFTQEFAQVVQPFQHLIQAQNSTPLQAVRNLMTTAAGLMMGTPQQKAAIVAEIISSYGVDVTTLDAVLSGEQQLPRQPANGQQGMMNPQFMQALQPIYSFMNEIQQTRQQRVQQQQQQANEAIENFSAQPFFEDLREDMADILEMSAKRGVTMTMEQAYKKAIKLNPEVDKILSQRAAAAAAKKNGGRVAAARRKASSISGGPSNSQDGKNAPKTRREMLERAWEEAESR